MVKNKRIGFLIIICFILSATSVVAQSVSLSHPSGFYSDSFQLSLSSSLPNADIRYTLDGSAPTIDSPNFTQPIHIVDRTLQAAVLSTIPTNTATNDEAWREPRGDVFKATVIRAAVFVGGVAGPEVFATYFVNEDIETRYDIPVVSIITDFANFFSDSIGIYTYMNNNMWQRGAEWERPILIQFFETDKSLAFSQGAAVRLHGNTTRSRPIKSLRIYARDDVPNGKQGFTHPIFKSKSTQEYRRFNLRNSGNDWDQSYLRDGFMQTLITDFFPDVQHYRPSVVFLNGEYWGIHNIRDRYDDHYLNQKYGVSRGDITILERNSGLNAYEVSEGLASGLTHYSDLVEVASNANLSDSTIWSQLNAGMDLDNYTDFYLSHIYFRNTDWPGNNVRIWRSASHPDHQRWKWMVYDTEFGYDLQFPYVPGVDVGAQHNTLSFALATNGGSWPNPPASTRLMRRLLNRADFKSAFIDRYLVLLHTAFSAENAVHVLDSLAANIAPYIAEHSDRWGGFESVEEWESHIDRMRAFAEERPEAMLNHLKSHIYPNTSYVNVTMGAGDGGQLVAARHAFSDPIAFKLPSDHVFTVTAVADEGYRFVEWTGVPASIKTNPVLRYQPFFTANIEAVFALDTSVDIKPEMPDEIFLEQNFPNPFNPSTEIHFALRASNFAQLEIFDMIGRRVALLVDDILPAGTHSVTFNATGLPSGVYVMRLRSGGQTLTRRMMLLK